VVATTPAAAAELVELSPELARFLGGIRHSQVTRAWWRLPVASGDPAHLLQRGPAPSQMVLTAAASGTVLKVAAVAYGATAVECRADFPARVGSPLEQLASALLPALRSRPCLGEVGYSFERAVTLFGEGHFRQLATLRPWRVLASVALAGDYLVSPTIEGAILSGERAAAAIRSHILESVIRRVL